MSLEFPSIPRFATGVASFLICGLALLGIEAANAASDDSYGPTQIVSGICPRIPTSFPRVYNVSSNSQFDAAYAAVRPGEAIIVRNGTYSGGSALKVLNRSGTSLAPIYILAQSVHGVDFRGSFMRFQIDGAYQVVAGFRWTNATTSDIFSVRGPNNRIACNAIYSAGGAFLRTDSSGRAKRLEIDNNMLDNLNKGMVFNRCDPAVSSCTTNSTNIRVHHNRFQNVRANSNGQATISWINPTRNVDGSIIPATGAGSLNATIVQFGTCTGSAPNFTFGTQQGEQVFNAPATSGTLTGLVASANYCFRARSRNTFYELSGVSGAVSRAIPPSVADREAIQMGDAYFAYEGTRTYNADGNDLRMIVENNMFDGWNGAEQLITVKSSRNIIRNNCIRNAPDTHIVVRLGDDNLITGNWQEGGRGAYRISGRGNYFVFNYQAKRNSGSYAFRPHQGSRSGNQYTYRQASNGVWRYNVFANFGGWIQVRDRMNTHVDAPRGNVFSENAMYSTTYRVPYANLDGTWRESQFRSNNTWGSNTVVNRSLPASQCGNPALFAAPGGSGAVVPGNSRLLYTGDIRPPSWWQ